MRGRIWKRERAKTERLRGLTEGRIVGYMSYLVVLTKLPPLLPSSTKNHQHGSLIYESKLRVGVMPYALCDGAVYCEGREVPASSTEASYN